MTTVIGILLIIMAVFLVISVLMQSSKDHRLSGSIAGGAETFFGKTKGKSLDAMFNKFTTVIAIIFVILVILLYVGQPDDTLNIVDNTGEIAQEESDAADADETVDDSAVTDNAENTAEDGAENVDETPVADQAPEAEAEAEGSDDSAAE